MSSIYLECDKCSTTFCMPDNHWERSKDLRNEAVAAGWVCTEGLDRCFTDYCPRCEPNPTAHHFNGVIEDVRITIGEANATAQIQTALFNNMRMTPRYCWIKRVWRWAMDLLP